MENSWCVTGVVKSGMAKIAIGTTSVLPWKVTLASPCKGVGVQTRL